MTKDFKEFFEATMNEVQESAKTMEDCSSWHQSYINRNSR